MTILALIGNGLEETQLVTQLLDVEKIPRRPGYKPAQPDGLVLTGCQFEGLQWIKNPRDLMNARDKVAERQHTTRIQGLVLSVSFRWKFLKVTISPKLKKLAVQNAISSELEKESEQEYCFKTAHRRITGILEKSHRPILSYDSAPNAADLLAKKENRAK